MRIFVLSWYLVVTIWLLGGSGFVTLNYYWVLFLPLGLLFASVKKGKEEGRLPVVIRSATMFLMLVALVAAIILTVNSYI